MTDIPADRFLESRSGNSSSDTPMPDLPPIPEVPRSWGPRRAALLRAIWPDLSPKERAQWVQLLVHLRAQQAELDAAREELDRTRQMQKNQGLLRLLAQWQAEAATVDPPTAEAEWRDLQHTLNTNRAPGLPLFP